jgi:hypothetical protein
MKRALSSDRASYNDALSSEFLKVSNSIAAKSQVDMERAKLDLLKHNSACHHVTDPNAGRLQTVKEEAA